MTLCLRRASTGHPHEQARRLAAFARVALLTHPLEAGVIVVVVMVALFLNQQSLASLLAQLTGMLPEVVLLPFWNPALDKYVVGILAGSVSTRSPEKHTTCWHGLT